MEVELVLEPACATILLQSLVGWDARLVEEVILKFKSAIHRDVQVGLLNPHKPIITMQLNSTQLIIKHLESETNLISSFSPLPVV